MARSRGPSKVSTPKRPSFVLGSRPPSLFSPHMASLPKGDITHAPPRITAGPTGSSTRNYAKTSAKPGVGFGNTGLTSET